VSEAGKAFVMEFLEPRRFAQMIEEWRVATRRALEI
jgi:hypothetical protein